MLLLKGLSCERLALVVNAFSLTVNYTHRWTAPCCSVDEDAVVKFVKLTEAQVALRAKRLQCVDVLKRLQFTDEHMVAVIPCMWFSGSWGAFLSVTHIYIYTLSENSVTIIRMPRAKTLGN